MTNMIPAFNTEQMVSAALKRPAMKMNNIQVSTEADIILLQQESGSEGGECIRLHRDQAAVLAQWLLDMAAVGKERQSSAATKDAAGTTVFNAVGALGIRRHDDAWELRIEQREQNGTANEVRIPLELVGSFLGSVAIEMGDLMTIEDRKALLLAGTP